MKFEGIIETINKMIYGWYTVDENTDFCNNLLSLADQTVKNKHIIRIKRDRFTEACWKTIVFAELECNDITELRKELKSVINWVALLKQWYGKC